MYCVETKQLSHSYSSGKVILDNINLQVPSGAIYGFLGPNGAGKTTSLKLLLGLLKKQHGDIHIFNTPLHSHRINILQKTGSLIESPSLYGQLSALENLQVLQKIYRCSSKRIQEVLRTVGLHDTGKKKVSQFSLGMKQRLSIAVAILHQPSLLILDEPTNGLDPNGIIEIRGLLKCLNEEQGISISISSHLLAEIEKIVTHVGIISHGKIRFQGTLKDLVNEQQQSSKLVIETNDPARSMEIIQSMQLTAVSEEGRIILPIPSREVIARLNNLLVQNGIEVYEMSVLKKDLESTFMKLINLPTYA